MCLICLKGPKHGEKNWQNIKDYNEKKKYYNILKLFCLDHLMSTVLFFRVWLWNQEIVKTYEGK
jgi:hypothetical protein